MLEMIKAVGRDSPTLHGRSTPSDDDFVAGCKLLRACSHGNLEHVRALLGISPHLLQFCDYDRRTAMHVAASEGHVDLVRALLELGASPNKSDRWGGSPLDDAQRHRFPAVASVLRQHGGRGGVQDHGLALILAASKGDATEVQSLVSDGVRTACRRRTLTLKPFAPKRTRAVASRARWLRAGCTLAARCSPLIRVCSPLMLFSHAARLSSVFAHL